MNWIILKKANKTGIKVVVLVTMTITIATKLHIKGDTTITSTSSKNDFIRNYYVHAIRNNR